MYLSLFINIIIAVSHCTRHTVRKAFCRTFAFFVSDSVRVWPLIFRLALKYPSFLEQFILLAVSCYWFNWINFFYVLFNICNTVL